MSPLERWANTSSISLPRRKSILWGKQPGPTNTAGMGDGGGGWKQRGGKADQSLLCIVHTWHAVVVAVAVLFSWIKSKDDDAFLGNLHFPHRTSLIVVVRWSFCYLRGFFPL